jgi:hypothetical protein
MFHQGLAWVAQVTMLLVLGLLVFPSQLGDVAVKGTVLALVLVFLARPVAALASTVFGGFTIRERSIIAWAGLRGAAPVVPTFPVIEHVPGSLNFFNEAGGRCSVTAIPATWLGNADGRYAFTGPVLSARPAPCRRWRGPAWQTPGPMPSAFGGGR